YAPLRRLRSVDLACEKGAFERMSDLAGQEYKVLVTHRTAVETDADQSACWRATVLGFPDLVAEACSREQALSQVKARLEEVLRHSEVVTLTAPASLNGNNQLAQMGWDDYGFFANDPAALELFDEIEEERNQHLIEPSQA